jgi:hypothetical protein
MAGSDEVADTDRRVHRLTIDGEALDPARLTIQHRRPRRRRTVGQHELSATQVLEEPVRASWRPIHAVYAEGARPANRGIRP